ncbi:MAG: LytTR family DNA-binding domain-containing protein [Bacteroidota bacterium]
MKALLVEDEKHAREALKQLLDTFCPDVQIIGEAGTVKDAIKKCKLLQFDILFLDIELPDGSGIDLLRHLSQRDFQVIFITAYNQYALDAFRLSASDYLLKPVNPTHLVEAVKKVAEQHARLMNETSLNLLMHNWSGQESKMMLRDSENIYIIRVKEILNCMADGGYTRFFLEDGREILTSINLKEYEKMLAKWGFIRSHHSHLVNYNHITRFNKTDGGTLVLSNGKEVPVSARKKEQMLRQLQEFASGHGWLKSKSK